MALSLALCSLILEKEEVEKNARMLHSLQCTLSLWICKGPEWA